MSAVGHSSLQICAPRKQDEETKRWKTVSYEAYKAANPRSLINHGVMETFVQTVSMDTVLKSGEFLFKRIHCPPKLLSACSASCIHAALEAVVGSSVGEVLDLALRSDFVIYNDGPDVSVFKC